MVEKIIGNIYSGFKLLEIRKLDDIRSDGFLLEHVKSGARLLYISNDDDNKVFYIAFRTPSNDSTGVAHILEHSVLCGSRKYKAKEPFVELLKGSLNTYLNAMTYPDKTIYPIASRNDKDFKNLMDVYMDAVFYPVIYDRPEVFLQEGWHYGLTEQGDLTYKGVVYNEMKGAFSSSDRVLDNAITDSLFPDNCYRLESGGDPKNIPDLSYEQFLEFHKRYYHPSNSYIYLYGNGDMDEYLKYLNEEYLQNFDKISVDSQIAYQKPFDKSVEVMDTYSIAQEETDVDKTYLAKSFVVGKTTDSQLMLSFDILKYMLMQTPASPLKQALLDAGIGKSVYGYFDSSICQPIFSIIAENANKEDKQKFIEIIDLTLKKVVAEGFDKKLIEGAINIWEFTLREADYGYRPKGLAYGLQAMTSWLYEGDPMVFMNYSKDIEVIKAALASNYFEKLIEKYFLNNTHSSVAVVIPEKGLETKLENELLEKLMKIKNNMTHQALDQITQDEKKLEKYHQTPDTKETLEQIPMLELVDIERKARQLPIEIIDKNNYKLLYHLMNTNKIVYLSMIFDSTTIQQKDIPYISLLATILGKISTQNYNYDQLSNEISIYTGGIGFASELFTARDGKYYPKFFVSSKVLVDKLPKMIDLLIEILFNTKFTEDKRLKDIIREFKTNMLSSLLSSGSVTAARRAVANVFQANAYDEQISNIAYYEFLCDIDKKLDSDIDSIKEKLIDTANKIFNKNNLFVSVAIDEENKELFEKSFKPLEQKLSDERLQTYSYHFEKKYRKEGFLTASKIQYVAKAVDYKKAGYEFDGSMMVLQSILDLDYLWNSVRVQGGAYGVLISIAKNGYIIMSSYRDPNIKKTLEAYDNSVNYLSQFNVDERQMRKYIIGTINSMDATMNTPTKAKVAAIRYITGVSHDQIQKERDEVLATSCDKIKSYVSMLSDAMKQDNIAVIGNENALKQNKELFEDLNTVFQN